MYQQLYDEIAQDTSSQIRKNEVRAFSHSIDLLKKAKVAGNSSRESVEALFFLNRLWACLLEDLSSAGNGLPAELRGKLISIGIWVLKRAEAIRQGEHNDFQSLIDISQHIYAGLQDTSC
jgi:flagellar biosynthesis activator protein FlaF